MSQSWNTVFAISKDFDWLRFENTEKALLSESHIVFEFDRPIRAADSEFRIVGEDLNYVDVFENEGWKISFKGIKWKSYHGYYVIADISDPSGMVREFVTDGFPEKKDSIVEMFTHFIKMSRMDSYDQFDINEEISVLREEIEELKEENEKLREELSQMDEKSK